MRGRQTGTFVAYAPDASIAMAFPPRGASFAVTQSHWFRMKDGKVAEHRANRDDRSMGEQLGWPRHRSPQMVRGGRALLVKGAPSGPRRDERHAGRLHQATELDRAR